MLDYLRVISQPDNNDALARIINTPSRRIGESTIKSLLEEADGAKITLWSLVLGIVQGKLTAKTKLKNPTEKYLSSFVNIILTAKAKMGGPMEDRMSTVELINFVIKKTDYEEWLVQHHGDVHKARWENVQELITQATDFQDSISFGYEDETLPGIEGLEQEDDSDHLSKFLANVALASEVKKNDEEGPTVQVTISTIHAAKGLEWPVVFVPAAYQGSIPHSRAEDTNEERRLLYVAMTRAKALLYMSYPLKNSQGEETTLSPFLTPPSIAPLLDQKGPSLRSSTIQSIAQILRRNLPSAESISLSSSSLPSIEDDLFPKEGKEDVHEMEVRLNSITGGNPTFTMGQHAPKRRRVELGRSISNPVEGNADNWKTTHATTMDRASSFTTATITMKSGFVSAGCHLQVLKEQSVNVSTQDIDEVDRLRPSKGNRTESTKKSQSLEGQGTLFNFLGKPEPKRAAPPKVDTTKPFTQFSTSRTFNKPRPIASYVAETSIDPTLSTHRLPTTTNPAIRRQHPPSQAEPQAKRNDYVFLSSSPPRPKHPIVEEPLEPPPGLVAKPPLLPLIRPPICPPSRPTSVCMHETSIDRLKNAVGGVGGVGKGKTLGVRRSMNGWAARKGGNGGFVPPVMKRPGS